VIGETLRGAPIIANIDGLLWVREFIEKWHSVDARQSAESRIMLCDEGLLKDFMEGRVKGKPTGGREKLHVHNEDNIVVKNV